MDIESFHDEVVCHVEVPEHPDYWPPTATERKRLRRKEKDIAKAVAAKQRQQDAMMKELVEYKHDHNRANADDQMDAYKYMAGQLGGGKTAVQAAQRRVGKQQAHAAAYGMGGFAQTMNRIQRYQEDGPPMKNPDANAGTRSLPIEQQRWARAFDAIMDVGPNFYVRATPERKRHLEEHYTALSQQDTPKGRKAARIIAHRVMAAIDAANAPVPPPPPSLQTTLTGRMSSPAPSLQNIARVNYPGQQITPEREQALEDYLLKYFNTSARNKQDQQGKL